MQESIVSNKSPVTPMVERLCTLIRTREVRPVATSRNLKSHNSKSEFVSSEHKFSTVLYFIIGVS